jgi:[acyl-carrier-protein] S-malonyltransferase
MDFSDAVSLVRKRGKYMQEAVPVGVGAMAAILGLENQYVVECCREASDAGIVSPANFNCPGQIVIAGHVKAVEKAVELCKEKGAKRSAILPVSAPFHCSLLEPASEKLAIELEGVKLNKMQIPVVTNETAGYVYDETRVKDLLIKQVSSPVLWEDSVRTMLENGVDTFVEIGPGKTLCGFVKKVSKEVRLYNVEDLESLDKVLNELA